MAACGQGIGGAFALRLRTSDDDAHGSCEEIGASEMLEFARRFGADADSVLAMAVAGDIVRGGTIRSRD